MDGKDTYFLILETQEEDDDRTRIYNSTEMDGAIQYGKPGKRTPLWLSSIMKRNALFKRYSSAWRWNQLRNL